MDEQPLNNFSNILSMNRLFFNIRCACLLLTFIVLQHSYLLWLLQREREWKFFLPTNVCLLLHPSYGNTTNRRSDLISYVCLVLFIYIIKDDINNPLPKQKVFLILFQSSHFELHFLKCLLIHWNKFPCTHKFSLDNVVFTLTEEATENLQKKDKGVSRSRNKCFYTARILSKIIYFNLDFYHLLHRKSYSEPYPALSKFRNKAQ